MADNLTSRGARANTPARLPALPASTAVEPARRQWEEQVREWLEVRLGARGDRFERAVTFRDLDPVVADIGQRLLALENESAASVEDCCKQLRSQLSAIWAAIYLLRADVDLLDVVARKRVLEVKDIVVDSGTVVGDPYYANVTLLIQGGTDGGAVINDLSSYASTVTITSDASFDSAQQVYSSNTIKGTRPGPTIPAFTSTGVNSRFSRPSNESTTLECFFKYSSLQNVDPSAYFWQWNDSGSGRIAELGMSGLASLRFRINNNATTFPATLAANTLHFLQLTISGNTYYLDLNGTQLETGTFPAHNNASTYTVYVASSNSPNGTGVSSYWVSPLRMTKGVARARGSVPTAAWATSTGTVTGPTGNALLLESNAYTTVVDPASPTSVTDIRSATFSASSPQVGIAHLSSPNGENTQIARSGKRYFEIRNGSGRMFIGFLANSGFTSNYPTTRDPFGTTGYYCITNIDYRSCSAGLITNGTASANSSYAWNWGTPVNVGTNTYDMIGVAVDFATGKVWFSKAGTWISGDPAAGTSPTFTLPDANFTPVIGAYPDTGVTPTALICPRAGTTVSLPPTGFTWYA